MIKKKKIIIGAAASVALLICGVVLFLIIVRNSDDDSQGRLSVYFYNAAQGQLEAELRDLPQGSFDEQINAALRYFFDEPQNTSLARVWPSDVEFMELVAGIYIEENILVASFSELYGEISPVDEVLFRSAFTLTMVGLPYIEGVMFRTFDCDERIESAATIANNPFISPARRTAEDFTLYFADETGEGLITSLYVAIDVNVHTRAQYVLERLIERQNAPGILPLIPAETRVRDVLIELDAGIYVDLSPEFHSRFSGNAAQARLMLQSITHTMLENIPGPPRRVFFLIDSERWDDFHGVSDFNLGFTIDETVMLGYVEPQESGEAE